MSKSKVMQEFLIVGMDISKSSVDICFKPSGISMRILNNLPGFKKWLIKLKTQSEEQSKVLVIMEHTGQYSYRLEKFLMARSIDYCKVPALHSSGTSIRGRSRTSHLANKEAKTLLSMAAACAIRTDWELKQYYQKRVSEGMNKMSCLNIIRSKIVARMFAVIKRQSPYQELSIAA